MISFKILSEMIYIMRLPYTIFVSVHVQIYVKFTSFMTLHRSSTQIGWNACTTNHKLISGGTSECLFLSVQREKVWVLVVLGECLGSVEGGVVVS